MKIKSLEEIYFFSLLSRNLRSLTFSWEHPLIKQTCTDQQTRFKASVTVGSYYRACQFGHQVLYGGSHHPGQALHHPCVMRQLLGEEDWSPTWSLAGWLAAVALLVHLIPAPRGTGTVSAPVPKLLMMAGIDDSSSARGCTATLGNFTKATFDTISKTHSYLIPDLRKETVFTKSLYQNSLTIL